MKKSNNKNISKKTTISKTEIVAEDFSVPKIGVKPLKWQDPVKMAEKIEEYFKLKPYTRLVHSGGRVIKVPNITMSGLAFYLGFASRQSLYEYEKKSQEFAFVIQRARLFIEQEYEKIIQSGSNSTGALFVLNNMLRRAENTTIEPLNKVYVLPDEMKEITTHIENFIDGEVIE